MAIADKLAYLGDTKQLIRQALEGVGQYVPNDSTTFREYVTKLADSQRTLGLNFAGESYDTLNPINSVLFDTALTFTRGSSGAYYDRQGVLQTAAVDEERITHDPSSLNSSVDTFDLSTLAKNGIITVNLASTNTYSLGDVVGVSDSTTIANHFYALIVEVSGDVLTCQVTSVGGTGSISAWTVIKSEGLLIEEQRPNLLLWSEAFDNAVWSKSGATVTSGAGTAPDGSLSAFRLVEDSALSTHEITQSLGTLSGDHTLELFAKAGEREWFFVNLFYGNTRRVFFNLSTGAIGQTDPGVTASIENVGEGWFRLRSSRNESSATLIAAFGAAEADGVSTYTGDGTSGIYIWGAQLEQGSFPTSYIKTEASQVTRSAGSCTRALGNEFNPAEGTFLFEGSFDNPGALADYAFDTHTSTGADRIAILSDNTGQLNFFTNGSVSESFTPVGATITFFEENRVAISYNESSGVKVGALNGVSYTDTFSGGVSPDTLFVGARYSIDEMGVRCKLLKYIPRALTATELEDLTV